MIGKGMMEKKQVMVVGGGLGGVRGGGEVETGGIEYEMVEGGEGIGGGGWSCGLVLLG